MMEYKILQRKSVWDLKKDMNELAKVGWRLVNCWSVVSGMYEQHFAAMEKSL